MTEDKKPELRFSYSALSAFEGCPYRYFLSYIKRERGKKGIPLLRGIKLHADMEKAGLKPPQEMKDYLFNNNPSLFPVAEWLEEMGMTKPEAIELKIRNESYNFTGVIDRVDTYKGGRIIIDWKSGKDRGIEAHLRQLSLYGWLYETVENKEVDYWGVYYLDHHTHYIVPTDVLLMKESVEWLEEKVKLIKKSIELDNKFEPCPSWQCKWCDFRGRCPLVKK